MMISKPFQNLFCAGYFWRMARALLLCLAAVAAASGTFGGCKARDEKSEATQALILEGNRQIEEMKSAESKVEKSGVYLLKNRSELYLELRSTQQLQKMKIALEDYIKVASRVLKIAEDPSVALYNTDEIQEKVEIAKQVLKKVRAELAPTSEPQAL